VKLADALRILQSEPRDGAEFAVHLISGSTPEPLSHFLAAHLRQHYPERKIRIKAGQFGDLAGNLGRYFESGVGVGVLLLEWADLDPRLGLRQAGGWGRAKAADMEGSVCLRLQQLRALFEKYAAGGLVYVSPPTLPLPAVLPVPRWQASTLELKLEELLAAFLAGIGAGARVRVLSGRKLETASVERLDLKLWWQAGSPYSLPFASLLAEQIAGAIGAPPRMKGIITDLDETLWAGIVGDAGVDGVHWDLEHRATMHGIYQQFLQSLADDGVLLAIASKNDRSMVEQVLQRGDMLLSAASVFPVEAHWQPKPESAARILQTWNIGPESVVFVDDNPMEVAVMKSAFPAMECRQFPTTAPEKFWALLEELADRFGQSVGSDEDRLRLQSIRGNAERVAMVDEHHSAEAILRECAGVLTMLEVGRPPDPRALELVNKTNQFNLNGLRYTEGDWLNYLDGGGAVWMAAYGDKFGALGKIAVLAGRREGARLNVDTWVLSCRAFSRRIEFAMLDFLFREEKLQEVVLRYRGTERNTPFRDFLAAVSGTVTDGEIRISWEEFSSRLPALHLTIERAK